MTNGGHHDAIGTDEPAREQPKPTPEKKDVRGAEKRGPSAKIREDREATTRD